jgi:D-3-phosphoglycerate dehydrogenase
MKVLVADRFEQSGIDGLADAGCDVSYQPDLKDATLADARINLDQAPSDALLQAIRAGSSDILDLYVIAIEGH